MKLQIEHKVGNNANISNFVFFEENLYSTPLELCHDMVNVVKISKEIVLLYRNESYLLCLILPKMQCECE